ncbi:MAG: hypothetical protein JSW51_08370, partial [Gemmatimonadota bacterium]
MADKKLTARVEKLFHSVGKAHHKAYRDSGGADPEWPAWYAEHLHGELVNLVDSELSKSQLIYLLVLADKKRSKKKPKGDWPRYYAKFVL